MSIFENRGQELNFLYIIVFGFWGFLTFYFLVLVFRFNLFIIHRHIISYNNYRNFGGVYDKLRPEPTAKKANDVTFATFQLLISLLKS